MYMAFRHIYTTYINTPEVQYHLFCHELMKIVNIFRDPTVDMQLTEFANEDTGISTIKDNQGREMLFHYFKHKEFPVTFITKSDDYT